MLRRFGFIACLGAVLAAPAAAQEECKITVEGPQTQKTADCPGGQTTWTLTNKCGKTAIVRYLSLDAKKWGEVSVETDKSEPLRCCIAGNFTCQFESWTTEFTP
jgi:hypothetical protein